MAKRHPLGLGDFVAHRWIVDVCVSGLDGDAKLAESIPVDTREQADDIARFKTQVYEGTMYSGKVREATPRDLALQRLEEIGEAVAMAISSSLEADSDVLVYDTQEWGDVDFSGAILPHVEEALSQYPPEDQDPVRMGWVGDDGLP